MFFKNFNNVIYNFSSDKSSTQITERVMDLTTRVSLRIDKKDLSNLCSSYIIEQGDTPEIVADKLYKNSELHWTILYINKIADVYSQWPLSEFDLREFCKEKYGTEIDSVKHSIKIPENIVMDKNYILSNYDSNTCVDITNWEYESQKNDEKRIILVIKPTLITTFVNQFMENLVE